MGTDFFDRDLSVGRRETPAEPSEASEPVGDTISAHSISKLVVQKHERSSQMAGAAQEIELLRLRQRELEKEKETLEALTRKQEVYEREKQDVVAKLDRTLVVFDKQAAEAMRAADLIATVRKRFEESLLEVRAIDENGWHAGGFEAELNKALAVVEQAQSQYKKGMSKVMAASWFRGGDAQASDELAPVAATPAPAHGFAFWLKAGVAFSLPLVVVIAACFTVWFLFRAGTP